MTSECLILFLKLLYLARMSINLAWLNFLPVLCNSRAVLARRPWMWTFYPRGFVRWYFAPNLRLLWCWMLYRYRNVTIGWIIVLANMHATNPGIGLKHPWAYYLHVVLLPYFTAECSVHFRINWFVYNVHDGLYSFLCEFEWENALIRIKTVVSIFINLQYLVAHSTYSLGNSSSVVMYDIYIHGRNDWKIAAKMYTLEVG